MSIDSQAVSDAIHAQDGAAVRELLRQVTEEDRRAIAKALKDLLKEPQFPNWHPKIFFAVAAGSLAPDPEQAKSWAAMREKYSAAERAHDQWRAVSQNSVFVAAAVGLAGGVNIAIKALDDYHNSWEFPEDGYDLIAGVLADRNPDWLPDLITRRLTAEFGFGVNAWRLTRRLVRLGVIPRPGVPEYTTAMPGAVTPWSRSGSGSPLSGLLADPGLLDEEVWRLFTVPGAEPAVAWPPGEWSDAIVTLAERGLLDRGRLLDACLDAFVRDFPPNHVGWYLECHDRLAPTLDEIAARSGKYLALLLATSKVGITLGQRTCGLLLRAGLLDADAFLTAAAAVLAFPQKSVAVAQLRLIDKIAGGDPPARDRALTAAAAAFAHVREDVQLAALKLIGKYRLPAEAAARAAIIDMAAALSPTLAPEAVALGLIPGTAIPDTANEPTIAPQDNGTLSFPTATPAPESPERVEPVTDPAELVQLLAQLIEEASDSLAVERALAGAVRLAALPLADRARLADPLLKRAAKQAAEDWNGPFSGHSIRADLARLTQAWATGEQPPVERQRGWSFSATQDEVSEAGEPLTMAGILTARIVEACAAVAAGTQARLLAEPEFADGTISHRTLLDRVARTTPLSPRRRYDLEVALLRLAPGADDAFWAQWAGIDPGSADTARRAYRETPPTFTFELTADGPNWPTAAARLALPDPAAPDPSSHCLRLLSELTSPALAEHGRHGQAARMGYRVRWDEIVAAWPLLAPHQPELIAAHLLRPLSDGLEPGRSAATVAVNCLAPAGRPFGRVGHFALVTGLASAEPDTRVTAASAWTRVVQDGRIDPVLAADAITLGVTRLAYKINRIAEALQHAAADRSAARAVADAAMLAAAGLLPSKPTGLHLLLELAGRAVATSATASGRAGTAAQAPPAIPPALAELAGSRERTKLAEGARRLALLVG